MKKYIRALVVSVASVTLLMPAAQADAAGCVSKGEFNRVHSGMSVSRVHHVFGTNGRRTFRHGVISIRRYRPCPQHALVRVAYRRGHVSAKAAFWHVG